MSILNLVSPAPDGTSDLAPPPPKRAWLAFVLALIVPGTGQMYAGRYSAGLATLLVFLLSLLVAVTSFGHTAGGYGLYFAVSLYVYGFLDAYFGVLEHNAGIAGAVSGSNPRTAATLNFMTNGFGYFYLGERMKGVLMFVGMGLARNLVNRAMPHSPVLMLLWILVQIGFAWDAWRIARRQLLLSAPELAGHSWKAAAAGQIPPILPLAVTAVVGLPFMGWMLLGVIGQGAAGIDAAKAQITTTPAGLTYTNRAAGVRALLPSGWTLGTKPGELSASSAAGTCRVLVLREYLLKTPQGYMKSVDAQLSKKQGFSVHDRRQGTLDGRPSAEMDITIGTSVAEHMACARVGRSLYSLIAVARDDDSSCPGQLDWIRSNLHFGN